MPFGSTEVLLRKAVIRIGYDSIRSTHALILDAYRVVIEAKPAELSDRNELITMQVRYEDTPRKAIVNDATVIYVQSEPSTLNELQEKLSNVTLAADEPEVYEDGTRTVYVFRRGLLMNIVPRYQYVEYMLNELTLRAETLRLEALKPTLVNVLVDRIQAATLYYITPVEVVVENLAGETRVTIQRQNR